MSISKGSAQWDGTIKEGKGVMKPANGSDTPFSLGTRFEGQKGSNPEELIGAALSGCFSMALSGAFARAGITPVQIKTNADVSLEKQGEGFAITSIKLTCEANVPGLDDAKFQEMAEATKKSCPVSKALAGTTITLEAKLSS